VRALAAVMLIVFPASAASAHPLDISWQTSYVTVTAGRVDIEVKISVGVLVAPAFLADLDRDADRSFSDAEGRDYASRVLAKVALRIDGTAVPLSFTEVELPGYPQTQAGYGVAARQGVRRGPGRRHACVVLPQ
jgi:nickel/cobalt exporter